MKAPKNTPRINIFIDLRIMLFFDDVVPLLFLERTIETPTINIKNGYTKSVSVIPFQSACRSGEKVLLQLPGLFTIIIKAIVKPLKTSTDNNLLLFKCEMDAGHSGKSGRTSAIEEVAFDYAFALKISEKLDI